MGIISSKKFDNRWIGVALGLIGPFFGFIILWRVIYANHEFSSFANMIWSNSGVHSATVSLCLLFNLAFFFPFIWAKRHSSAMGVLIATLVYVPVVLFLKFF
ncbi:MAG: hypothetical protein ACK4K0_09870 [Flavobacteriales bacterium]